MPQKQSLHRPLQAEVMHPSNAQDKNEVVRGLQSRSFPTFDQNSMAKLIVSMVYVCPRMKKPACDMEVLRSVCKRSSVKPCFLPTTEALTSKEYAVDPLPLGIEVGELCNVVRNHAAQSHCKVCRFIVIQILVLCRALAVSITAPGCKPSRCSHCRYTRGLAAWGPKLHSTSFLWW
jgi:hypothetical protein